MDYSLSFRSEENKEKKDNKDNHDTGEHMNNTDTVDWSKSNSGSGLYDIDFKKQNTHSTIAGALCGLLLCGHKPGGQRTRFEEISA